jgi:hypothetical protein
VSSALTVRLVADGLEELLESIFERPIWVKFEETLKTLSAGARKMSAGGERVLPGSAAFKRVEAAAARIPPLTVPRTIAA